jgi:hypothetical protein
VENLVFRKVLDLSDIPQSWTFVRLAADWNGTPIVLFAEDKPTRPAAATDPATFARWYRTPPKAHHAVYFDGRETRTITFERSHGISTFHVQRLDDGWLLADRRGGRANLHDSSGHFLRSIDLGDASEDIQTTPDGKIWVSYFDEGVFGSGIGQQGAVCFDREGIPRFKYGDFAERAGLPFISDCYAMNVTSAVDVWFNYYTDFPLVHLQDFALERVSMDFEVTGKGFAVRDDSIVYARGANLVMNPLDPAAGGAAILGAQDESGKGLLPLTAPHIDSEFRGSNLLINTGSAVYVSV